MANPFRLFWFLFSFFSFYAWPELDQWDLRTVRMIMHCLLGLYDLANQIIYCIRRA